MAPVSDVPPLICALSCVFLHLFSSSTFFPAPFGTSFGPWLTPACHSCTQLQQFVQREPLQPAGTPLERRRSALSLPLALRFLSSLPLHACCSRVCLLAAMLCERRRRISSASSTRVVRSSTRCRIIPSRASLAGRTSQRRALLRPHCRAVSACKVSSWSKPSPLRRSSSACSSTPVCS